MHAPQLANPSEPAELLCGACNYNLRGIPDSSDRCPECGVQFDRSHLIGNLVAWEQARFIGRFKAFFKTMWIATVRIGALAEKASRPVSYRHARRFRWIVMFLAAAGLAGGLVWWYAETYIPEPRTLYGRRLQPDETIWLLLLNPWSFGVLVFSLVLWLCACIPSVTLFFHDKRLDERQQKRAIALSCYTSACMAWLPLAVPLAALIISLAGEYSTYMNPLPLLGNAILMLCWLAFVVQAISWTRWRKRKPRSSNGLKRILITLITAAIMAGGYMLVWRRWENPLSPARLIGWTVSVSALASILITVLLLTLCFNTLRLLRPLLHPSWRRTCITGAAILLTWLALGILIVGTVQATWIMVQIVMAAGG